METKKNEEVFELKDEELVVDPLVVDEARKVWVISGFMDRMPNTPNIVCLSWEDAQKAVRSEMRRTNVDLEFDVDPPGEEAWFHTAKKDAFMRVRKDIMKKHDFEKIRDDSCLYEYKYEIFERVVNKHYN